MVSSYRDGGQPGDDNPSILLVLEGADYWQLFIPSPYVRHLESHPAHNLTFETHQKFVFQLKVTI